MSWSWMVEHLKGAAGARSVLQAALENCFIWFFLSSLFFSYFIFILLVFLFIFASSKFCHSLLFYPPTFNPFPIPTLQIPADFSVLQRR